MDNTIAELVIIIVLGLVSQLAAWFTRLPSILILILAGFVAGPLLGILHPDAVFGNLFEPLVDLSVAVILFEGGLNLKFKEIKNTAPVVLRLLSVGVLITWAAAGLAAYLLLGITVPMAILLGSILVISGPTVNMPLVRYLRLKSDVSAVLKWESILVDPIGAILALAVLEVILQKGTGAPVLQIITILGKSLFVGGVLGWFRGVTIARALQRHILPDYLHIPTTLGGLVAVFMVSELLQSNAGLVAAIVMGAALANQQYANISHILEFKENLRLILLSFLFIVLSARFSLSLFEPLTFSLVVFILILVIVRPVVVFLSSIRSKLKTRDKLLLSCMAPRGIVAASVVSLFAFRLTSDGYTGGDLLTPVTFAVIFGTVLISSTVSPVLARKLQVGQTNPQGVIFFGGQVWVRKLAMLLKKEGGKCLIIDDNQANIAYAHRRELEAVHAEALSGTFLDDADFSAYSYAVAITADNNFNMLVAVRLSKLFGSSNVFLLSAQGMKPGDMKRRSLHLPGRILFDHKASYERIGEIYESGKFKIELLKEDVDGSGLSELLGEDTLICFAIATNGNVTVITPETGLNFKAGTKLIVMVPADVDHQSLEPGNRLDSI